MKGKQYQKPQQAVYNSKESVKSILQYPIADLTERGIRKEICERFNVRMSVSEEDRSATAWYFPCYNQKGVLSGWKRRDLLLDKNDDYYFTTIGKVGVDCLMFGQKEVQAISGKRSKLKLVEGEIDMMSAWQASVDSVTGTKWEGLEPHIVSILCGTANAVDNVLHNLSFVESYEHTHLAFDGDEATSKEKAKGIMRGKEATEAVAQVLMHCNLWVCELPEGFKDWNELLEAGRWKDVNKLISFPTKKFTTDKVIRGSEFTFDEVVQEREEGVYVETFPKLMDKIHGFRRNELSVICSLSGSGKSTIVSEISYCLAEKGLKVGMIFLEEGRIETFQRLMARYLQVPHNKFKFKPRSCASEEKLKEAFDWVSDKNRFIFFDHFGSLKIDELLSKVKYMHLMEKVDFLILDHLTLVVSGLDVKDERKELDLVLTSMATYVKNNDLGILAVSHLNRDASDELRGISKMTEPVWIKVKKESLRGSSSLEAVSWMVFGIDVEIMPDRTRGRVRLTCLKNRPFGLLGECDIIKMDEETGLLEDASFDDY